MNLVHLHHRDGVSIPDPAWRTDVEARLASQGRTIEDRTLGALLEATGLHPYDTMQVAYYAYLRGRDPPNPIDRVVVLAAIDQTENMLGPVFAAELDSWCSKARLVLGRLAHGQPLYGRDGSNSAIRNPLRDLLQAGVLGRLGRGR